MANIFSRSSNISGMQCILQISPTRFLIGGHQDKLVDFNLTTCKETTVVSVTLLIKQWRGAKKL